MKNAIAMTMVVFLLGISSVRAWGEDAALQTPEEYQALADRAYADKELSLEERKKVMEAMIAAGDRWRDDYGIQWRAAQAIHVYGDTMYYRYQWENYTNAVKNRKITRVEDVMAGSQKLDTAQSAELLRLGSKARTYADRAIALKPGGVEGHYYAAMAISLYAFGKSIVSALLEGLGPKYERNLDAAIKENKEYMDGALFAAYGRYWYKLPWPKRDLKKSLDDLLVAKQYGPDNIMELDFLGDTYYALGRKDEARQSWSAALGSTYKDYHGETVKKLVQAKLDRL